MKKTHIFLLLIIFTTAYLIITHKDTYVKSWTVKNSFEKDIAKEMRFVPLDYMGEYEYLECGKIYAKFKTNYKNIEYLFPKFAKNFEDFKEKEGIEECGGFSYLLSPYKYYNIEGNLLISGKRGNGAEEYVVYNPDLCDKEDFEANILGDGNSLILSYGQEYYMVSKWQLKGQYVIQPLHDSTLICRFNVE